MSVNSQSPHQTPHKTGHQAIDPSILRGLIDNDVCNTQALEAILRQEKQALEQRDNENIKNTILKKHKFTDLVFSRINKKIHLDLNDLDIKKYLSTLITGTKRNDIIKK